MVLIDTPQHHMHFSPQTLTWLKIAVTVLYQIQGPHLSFRALLFPFFPLYHLSNQPLTPIWSQLELRRATSDVKEKGTGNASDSHFITFSHFFSCDKMCMK